MDRLVRLMPVVVLAFVAPSMAQAQATTAQNGSPGGWLTPDWNKPPITAANRKPAPRRSLAGMWGPADGPGAGTQAQGVPRYNHYNIRLTQIFQDDYKVVMLYHYDNRWRVIWTDGRQLPKVVDGGVDIGGETREARFFGYSVGRWVDDYTFEVQTVGTMPEERVWLDSTGRPISDKARITETFRRVDADTLVWSETIDDPKVYTRPWETMRMSLRLHDPRTDIQEYYCSPTEQENYNRLFGSGASSKGAP